MNALIELPLLRPEMTEAEVLAGCEQAAKQRLAGVCVKPCHIKQAAAALRGTGVGVCAVIGFPHGASVASVKVAEAYQAISDGAVAVEMVINIGAARGGQLDLAREDIRAVCEAAHALGVSARVILETAYLSDEQKIAVCHVCNQAGVDWVVTSTGYAPAGATVEDVRLLRQALDPRIHIKAAQGISRPEQAQELLDAGAERIGTQLRITDYELRIGAQPAPHSLNS